MSTALDLFGHDPDAWDDGEAVNANDLAELDASLSRLSACVLALDPDPLSRMDPTESIPRHIRHAGRRM
jgi:hypothetical protein